MTLPQPQDRYPTHGDLVLVLNCGSSSIKFALFDGGQTPLPRKPVWNGKVQGIGRTPTTFGETGVVPLPVELDERRPYHAALNLIREKVLARLDGRKLAAVAHRVVHGGSRYSTPTRVTTQVLEDLRSYIPLAPLHQPFALEAIGELLQSRPDLPQVACFDTGFHRTLPQVEQMMALPYACWEQGLRRYGFHGLSYDYIARALPDRIGEAARGKVIVAHLGSGASLCAMENLSSVATTMGFSALEGLMMGTRCGSLDPGAVLYLMEIEKLSLEEVGQVLYHHSGLFGVSGVSADPPVLLAREHEDSIEGERIRAALALWVRRIVREIGALTAVLGGLDALVFTAGIGEHSEVLRERICRELGWLGVWMDAAANATHGPIISTPQSRVTVVVEPTNEEWIAAVQALDVVASAP
ncbi:MAG: acetate/propionate family kinase [Lysobacteraceae bacterium]